MRKINNRKVFIIAEAGVNHNGSVEIAKKLIDVAAAGGCDAVKFQTFKTESIITKTAPKAEYQIRNTAINESQFEMLKRLELSSFDYKILFSYCKRKNIMFMSTPFDEQSVDFLDRLGMEIFKISSGDITNRPLIQCIAEKRKPIILSTGMSYLEEVKKAVGWIKDIWKKLNTKPQLVVLHCVSDYPPRVEDVNLLAMKMLESTFGLVVGFSDHTLGIEISIAAVAMGAKVIEKHFTLDRRMEGPDHKFSLEPDELKTMVKAIRNVEKALGDGVKKPTENEKEMRSKARRSLVAGRNIKAGEIINREDISVKRPGTGIPPEFLTQIINKKARVDIKKDSLLERTHFC